MAKIVLYLSLLASVLPNIISASFPGDGCCIRWDRDGTCCINIHRQCCGDRGFGRDIGLPGHRHGPHRRPDDRFDGHRGDFGRDRSGFDNSIGREDRHGNEGNNNHGGGQFGGNNHQSTEGNNHPGGGQSRGNNGQSAKGNNHQAGGKSGGSNHQGSSSGQHGGGHRDH